MKNLTREEIDQKLVEYRALILLIKALLFPGLFLIVKEEEEPALNILIENKLAYKKGETWLLLEYGEERANKIHNYTKSEGFEGQVLLKKLEEEYEELDEADIASPIVDGLVVMMLKE